MSGYAPESRGLDYVMSWPILIIRVVTTTALLGLAGARGELLG